METSFAFSRIPVHRIPSNNMMLTNDGSRIPQTRSIYPKACVRTFFIFLAIFPKTPKNKKVDQWQGVGMGVGWRFPESVNAKVLLISGESFQHRIQRPGRGGQKLEICVAAYGSHLFMTYFYRAWSGHGPLGTPPPSPGSAAGPPSKLGNLTPLNSIGNAGGGESYSLTLWYLPHVICQNAAPL